MVQYIGKRLLAMIPTLAGVAVLTFVILRVIPGDVAMLVLGGDIGTVSPETLAAVQRQLGLDRSIWLQFVDWMVGVLTLDLGHSFYTGLPVRQLIFRRFALTAQIAVLATTVSVVMAILIGTWSARRQGRFLDRTIQVVTLIGLAVPTFWVGIVTLLAMVLYVGWSPPLYTQAFLENPWERIQLIALPAGAAALWLTAMNIRLIRATMIQTLRQPYIVAARSRGLPERVVIYRHALRNAIPPMVTLTTMEFGFMFGGLIVTEVVFSVDGLGAALVQAVTRRDFPIVQGIVLMITVVVMSVNLLGDLVNAYLNPRIRRIYAKRHRSV